MNEELKNQLKVRKFSEDEITSILDYTLSLQNKEVVVIYDVNHLAALTGKNTNFIYACCNASKLFYRNYYISKKNGGRRIINEPMPDLKEIQKWIAEKILKNIPISKYSKSYRKNHSIKSNAGFHVNRNKILNIDIKDYFGSIKEYRVYLFFLELGYYKDVAKVLSLLCCLNGSLPQGSPTSPILSNIITSKMDDEIVEFIKLRKLRYSRYADDITISGDFDNKEIYVTLKEILFKNGFKINKNKIHYLKSHQRQIVTGIVTNVKQQVTKEYRNEIRKIIYYINKYGIENHLNKIYINDEKNKPSEDKYLRSLLSKINYILFVNPADNECVEYKKIIVSNLNSLIKK